VFVSGFFFPFLFSSFPISFSFFLIFFSWFSGFWGCCFSCLLYLAFSALAFDVWPALLADWFSAFGLSGLRGRL
jgi:hypothetical protein